MNEDALSLVVDLQRYGGWLGKDHASVAVRVDVRELAAAMQAGHETSSWLQLLDNDLRRLQAGGVRTMLRRAFDALQAVLEP